MISAFVDKDLFAKNPKLARKIYLIKLFGIIGVLVTLPFGLLSMYYGNMKLSILLIVIAVFLSVNYFLVVKTTRYVFASNIIVYLFLLLFVYLVYSGGVENTGSLWIYAFPALALFLHGLKRGLVDIALFVILLTVMFLYPDDAFLSASYSDEYKLRLIFSFLVVSFLSSLYEYSSVKSHEQLEELTYKLIGIAKEEQLAEITSKRSINDEMEVFFYYAMEHDEDLSLVVCDINYLYDIQERYGKDVADMIIDEISKEIKKSIHNSLAISRWTGNEFLIVLPKTNYDDAYTYSKALEKRIKNLKIIHDRKPILCTLTTGVADAKNTKSIYGMIRHADTKMY